MTTTAVVSTTPIVDVASTLSSSIGAGTSRAMPATPPNTTLGLDLGAEDVSSKADPELDEGTSAAVSIVLIAGAVGGLILLVGMIVVARNKWLHRSAKGQLDILKIAKKSNIFADPAQYARFCRSVSFHGLRYNEAFLSISNTNLMLVYDLLLLERPEASDLGSLRFICTQFLRKDVFRDPPQYIDRSIGFIEESLVDVVLEELLDIYVQADRVAAQYSEASGREYAECCDPLYEEAVPLSLSDHLADSPEVPYEHFYDAIDEYLVGKRCVEPGTYALPNDSDPIYSELMLMTDFYRGLPGNRSLTSIIDAEYSVIKMPDGDKRKSSLIPATGLYNVANHRGASAEYMVANHRDSGVRYQVANRRSSAIYEVANIRASAVYETALGGGGDQLGGAVYDNMSRPGAEGRSSIVYETAGAMDTDRRGSAVNETAAHRPGSTVYEMAANIQGDPAATDAKENQMSPIYRVANKVSKKTPKRSGFALGDIGNQERLQPTYSPTGQPPVSPRLGNQQISRAGGSTPRTQSATTPRQRKGRSQFAVGVPVTQRSSLFLLAGVDLKVPDQGNGGNVAATDAPEQPTGQPPTAPTVPAATPVLEVRPPSCPLYDNTIGDGTLMLDVSVFDIMPSDNSQMIADITIGELPAYEEPAYLNQEELATMTMTQIKAEAQFGSRNDALISAIDDTMVMFPGEEGDLGDEPDFSGKRPMIVWWLEAVLSMVPRSSSIPTCSPVFSDLGLGLDP